MQQNNWPTGQNSTQTHSEAGQEGTHNVLADSEFVAAYGTAANAPMHVSGIMTAQSTGPPQYYLHDFYLPAQGATYTPLPSHDATPGMPSTVPSSAVSSQDPSAFAAGSTPIPVSVHSPSTSTALASPTSTSVQQVTADPTTSSSGRAAAASTSPSRRGRVQCPLCSSHFGRVPDLNRHLASVHRGGSDGPLWACCGVPVEEARSRFGLSDQEIAGSRRGIYNGKAMVGGCWGANFSRRDAYARHLRDQGCVGDPYGEYHYGNR